MGGYKPWGAGSKLHTRASTVGAGHVTLQACACLCERDLFGNSALGDRFRDRTPSYGFSLDGGALGDYLRARALGGRQRHSTLSNCFRDSALSDYADLGICALLDGFG